ncbi:S8 family peptidase [Brevundimonas balnearis]|uniref:S8 family peptidase n=2 Tax=Pseudomonadota TaxID=1224 RepID=A0ABV6R698_9CAUL
MANSRALSAWNQGATGAGVTVAVVDTGIDFDQPDLAGNISPLSTDVVIGRNLPEGDDRHGTRVAGVIGAEFNGFGTIGIAYDSTILSIRADISDCNDPDDTACFRSSDLTRAIDYAVANGAKVINLSLGGDGPLGSAFEAALLRAVQAGVVIAAASGNESDPNPSWPGRYASDPRFLGGIIVVGSHDANDVISDFSSLAGVSAANFISAPGDQVITDCDGTSCWRISGTSFAAPHVAGALALLLQAFPNLTGREAIDILLRTARDAGDVGTDTTYGRGLLDIGRAFQPVGATATPQSDGSAVSVLEEPGAYLGGAFGGALGASDALTTIAYDEYERMFTVDLGAVYRAAPRRSFQPETPEPSRTATVSGLAPLGTRLSLTASVPVPVEEPVFRRDTPFSAPWLGAEPRREALALVETGRLSFAAWQGQGGARAPFRSGAGDGFAALAQADHAMRGGVDLGRVQLSAETGSGDRAAPFRRPEEDASTYSRASALWRVDETLSLNLSAGRLDERLGPLGSFFAARSDLALPSTTDFAAAGGRLELGEGVSLDGEFGTSRTEIREGLLRLSDPAIGSTWRVGLNGPCWGRLFGCSGLRLELMQPLRIERGTFEVELADVPLEYFDPTTFSVRRLSAAPDGRELNLSLITTHRTGADSALQLQAMVIRDEGHRRNAEPAFALLGSWRRGF